MTLEKRQHDMSMRGARLGYLLTVWLLGFAFVMGSANAQILLPPTGYIETVAGNGIQGSANHSGLATNAELANPSGVAVDASGNIYIDTAGDFRILKVSASTGNISVVAGNGEADSYTGQGDGGLAINSPMTPGGLAIDQYGNIYFSDTTTSTIREVTASTGIITTVAGGANVDWGTQDVSCGYSGDGGGATAAQLCNPAGVAVDASENLYIADSGNSVIRMVTASTGIISTIYSAINGSAINGAAGVAIDKNGNIYIADPSDSVIVKIAASTGISTVVAGDSIYLRNGYAGDGGPATSAKLNAPTGVAVDTFGNIYISDRENVRIRMVSATTGFISTIAGNGIVGYSGDGGLAVNAEISCTAGISTDVYGNVYFADCSNERIRAIGTAPFKTSIVNPAYQVVSIVYAPPGNKSSAGFTNTTTDGSTTTIGSSISNSTKLTYTEGFEFLGVGGSVSQSFGTAASSTNSSAFVETFTDATSVSNQSNNSSSNAMNHNEDLFLIWLNPQVTVESEGTTPLLYSVGVQGSVLPDIVEVFANTMEANASGVTTVPAPWLNQQIDPATGAASPGLASICANLNQVEYSAGTCTLADQCGCLPSDFKPILSLDPLLGYSGTASPLDVNISSPADCGSLPTPSGDCRYVPVPAAKRSTLQEVQTLSGPETQGGNYNCNTFTQSDANSTTQTLGGSSSVSVGASVKVGSPGFSLAMDNTMTWMESQSTGTSSGNGNTQTVNLCSATVGCGEDVAVYEDTVFHTFVFQQPSGNISCP